MNKISVDLENCYGIGSLICEFDFTHSPVHAVYAPNGFMKTSFARTFRDFSEGKQSSDQMFPARPNRRSIRNESGAEINQDQVLVIPPYEENYQPQQISTLLVEASLKVRYDDAVADLEKHKKALLVALKARSGLSGKNVTPETEILISFGIGNVIEGLEVMAEAASAADSSLADVQYETLFGEKSFQFLTSPDALRQIEAYVRQFDELVSQSPILTAQFTHTQASSVHRSLADSRFFEANHWITLNEGGTPVEIRGSEEFRRRVDSELQRVMADTRLRSVFEAFDKKISGNAELRKLRDYLREHQTLIPRLADLAGFRRDVWAAFLAAEFNLLSALRAQYESSRQVIQLVVKEAQAQATDWAEVVELFNRRFSVPFRLRVENQADVILKEDAPSVVFEFYDNDGTTNVPSPKELLQALSQGERRALYLLNVLFQLRIKKASGGGGFGNCRRHRRLL